ncbi:hypothetical protein ACLMAB_15375 [Brevibacillus laterosporus]
MFHERERVKDRRQERKEQLLLQSRDSMPPHIDDLHDPLERVFIPDQYSRSTDFTNETPLANRWVITSKGKFIFLWWLLE